jgi:hypothetical protein
MIHSLERLADGILFAEQGRLALCGRGESGGHVWDQNPLTSILSPQLGERRCRAVN